MTDNHDYQNSQHVLIVENLGETGQRIKVLIQFSPEASKPQVSVFRQDEQPAAKVEVWDTGLATIIGALKNSRNNTNMYLPIELGLQPNNDHSSIDPLETYLGNFLIGGEGLFSTSPYSSLVRVGDEKYDEVYTITCPPGYSISLQTNATVVINLEGSENTEPIQLVANNTPALALAGGTSTRVSITARNLGFFSCEGIGLNGTIKRIRVLELRGPNTSNTDNQVAIEDFGYATAIAAEGTGLTFEKGILLSFARTGVNQGPVTVRGVQAVQNTGALQIASQGCGQMHLDWPLEMMKMLLAAYRAIQQGTFLPQISTSHPDKIGWLNPNGASDYNKHGNRVLPGQN